MCACHNKRFALTLTTLVTTVSVTVARTRINVVSAGSIFNGQALLIFMDKNCTFVGCFAIYCDLKESKPDVKQGVFFLRGEGPRSRCYGRTAALRLIVQPCDEDKDEQFFTKFYK